MSEKTKEQQLQDNREQGWALEKAIQDHFGGSVPYSYSREQVHGGNRLDFAIEDSGGDRVAIVEAKSGAWNDKVQAEGMITLAEDSRAKLLVTVGDQEKFSSGVRQTIEQAEREGRITHINVPEDKVGEFADFSKEIVDKVDATPNRNCPEVGREVKAVWEQKIGAEVNQATTAGGWQPKVVSERAALAAEHTAQEQTSTGPAAQANSGVAPAAGGWQPKVVSERAALAAEHGSGERTAAGSLAQANSGAGLEAAVSATAGAPSTPTMTPSTVTLQTGLLESSSSARLR
jgi:hypothetical protein